MKCYSLKSLHAMSNSYLPSRAQGCYNRIYNMNANCRECLWSSVSICYISLAKVLEVVFGIGVLNETYINNVISFITNEMYVFKD